MTRYPSKNWLYKLLFQSLNHSRRHSRSGFTLLEILVSLIISGIVVSGLLFLIVNLLQTDQRETVLEQTQRNMKRALDYIADDLQEAVFVYSDPTEVIDADTGITDLPNKAEPILAFWRLDPIDTSPLNTSPPSTDICDNFPIDQRDECRVLKVRQAAYTLVVYAQTEQNSAIWKGRSRLIRYQLKKYKSISKTNLEQREGYLDPSVPSASFEEWSRLSTASATDGQSAALVDYLDKMLIPDTVPTDQPDCSTLTGNSTDYVLSPSNAEKNTSFFTCIRRDSSRLGQDVFLFIQGNPNPRGTETNGLLVGTSNNSQLPRLQTQVLVRGVINKTPQADDD